MTKEHIYNLTIKWTGNKGQGTIDYRSYEREYKIWSDNKVELIGSSDPSISWR